MVAQHRDCGGAVAARRSPPLEFRCAVGSMSWKTSPVMLLAPRRSPVLACGGGGAVERPEQMGTARLLWLLERGGDSRVWGRLVKGG